MKPARMQNTKKLSASVKRYETADIHELKREKSKPKRRINNISLVNIW